MVGKGKGRGTELPPLFFESGAELEAWLEEHHASEPELIVGLYKKETGHPSVTYDEMLDAALCHGWIDGVRRSLGDGRWTIRITPRTPRSIWSRVNIRKAKALVEAGRMRPAGLAAFEARDEKRSEVYSFEQAQARLDPAEEAEFRANADAWSYFQGRTPSYCRATTWWVVSAKRPETRRRRLETLIDCSARHTTVQPMTPSAGRKPGQEPG